MDASKYEGYAIPVLALSERPKDNDVPFLVSSKMQTGGGRSEEVST